jgi:syndecan 1
MTTDGSDRSFGAPRFDVVLRGYDRRQVDEHISRLQRLMGRMRNDLDAARGQPVPPTGPPTPAGGRLRPTPRPRPDGLPATGGNDVVGSFTDRMHAILQAAEEEAAEIRGKARAAVRAEEERAGGVRASVRAEEEAARRNLADLARQRDAVLAELTRVRGQLEGLLSGPTTRIKLPVQEKRPERREFGAGQPLPGTPEPSAGHAPPVPPVSPTANGVGSGQQPSGESSGRPEEAAVERTAVMTRADRTALMERLADEPDDPGPDDPRPDATAFAEESTPVEATQVVSLSGHTPAEGSGAGATPDRAEREDDSANRAEATQIAPASPARS